MELDYGRLAVMWIMAAVVTFGLIVSHQTRTEEKKEPRREALVEESPPDEPGKAAQPGKKAGLALSFPERSVGSLLVESDDDEEYLDLFHEARGRVPVEKGQRLQLEFDKDDDLSLAFLSSLGSKEAKSTIYSVDLSGCRVEDDDLRHLRLLPALEELDLSDTGVTDAGLEHLKELSGLQKLWLDGTKVSASAADALSELSDLTKLSVSQNLVLDIKSIEEKLPACKVVSDEGNS